METQNIWIRMLQASLEELLHLRGAALSHIETLSKDQSLYLDVLISYFRQDAKELMTLLAQERFDNQALQQLLELRYQIRANALTAETLKVHTEYFKKLSEPLFKGELAFVLGYAFRMIKDYKSSTDYYQASVHLLEKAGLRKKSVRALLCVTASYSCEYPDARLFSDYTNIHRKALEAEEYPTAGAALLNISREFQRLEAFSVALDYALKAEEIFAVHCFASREHGLCLTHRAHLFFQMARNHEALKSLELALASANSEVQSAAKILAEKYKVSLKTLPSGQVTASWQERSQEPAKVRPMGDLEERLVKLLIDGVSDKMQILDALYGDRIDFEARENRFKNLMSRVRMRHPGLIIFKEGAYHLVDPRAMELQLKMRKSL